MPASVSPIAPRETRPSAQAPPGRRRTPFLDNPRLILGGIAALVAVLIALVTAANRSPSFSPDFLTEFVLYALTAADLTMLAALVFVLARNIVKLVVERRRRLPFARFRAKLVALLLAMTLVPSILVLVVGSELIRTNIDRWFNRPMDDVLSAANELASNYYSERQLAVREQADRIARSLADVDLGGTNLARVRDRIAPDVTARRLQMVEVYRVGEGGVQGGLEPVIDVAAPTLPTEYNRAAAERLALQAVSGSAEARSIETLRDGGDLLHAASVVRDRNGVVRGAVVATDHLTGDLAERSRRMTESYEAYNQLRVLRRPLTGVYLSFFLMVTLLILFGATWMGSYLAKRITRPVHTLAAAAREIGAGRLDQQVEAESDDEFGGLIDDFNAMARELAASRRRIERSTVELQRQHVEADARRRYIETVLERIATGVVSVDAGGTITMMNAAAERLLALDSSAVGGHVGTVFARTDLQPLAALCSAAGRGGQRSAAEEVTLPREGHELHLAAAATPLVGEHGAEGVVLVLDDVTPLIRTQKVAAWREVARRLAHEIKNPLTPIQLSAERLQRHFSSGPSGARALVDECTRAIVTEVESLKGLVDEFSQFARMPSPRAVPANLDQLVSDVVTLYEGVVPDVAIERRTAGNLPLVRLDAEQIRRVVINLVDNAIEAMERRGHLVIETSRDDANRLVRLVVSDDGPGIPPAERDKLFLPYYSTKGRGSGLGLAIVRRIIAEHGGSIDVTDNHPRGSRFTIELPCS
jgi:two-component system nitrogen regulation sensor histidine kinase NtrY